MYAQKVEFLDNLDLISLLRLADFFICNQLVEIVKGTILDRLSVFCFNAREFEYLQLMGNMIDLYPISLFL